MLEDLSDKDSQISNAKRKDRRHSSMYLHQQAGPLTRLTEGLKYEIRDELSAGRGWMQ